MNSANDRMSQLNHSIANAPIEPKRSAELGRMPRYWDPPFFIFSLFLVFVWSRYIQAPARADILAKTRFEFLLGSILIGTCILLIIYRPLRLERSRHVLIGISLLFFAMVIQIPFAASVEIAKDVFIDRVVKHACLAFFIAVLIRSPKSLRWFIVVYLISIFWVLREAVIGLVTGSLLWWNQGILRLHGAVPIYGHPNSLGGVAMDPIPFVVFLWPVFRLWWQRLGLITIVVASALCIVYSGSRTAYVALLAFGLYWFSRFKKKMRFLLVGLITIPILVLSIPGQYVDRFKSIGGQEAAGRSKEARIVVLKDAWSIFVDHPLGVGLRCFPVVRMERYGRAADTHNLYLEIATNLGVQGVIVYIYFIGAIMYSFFAAHRSFGRQRRLLNMTWHRDLPSAVAKKVRYHDRDLQFLCAMAEAAAGFIFARLALGMFGMDLFEPYWWFGAGIAICLMELTKATRQKTQYLRIMLKDSSSV